MPGLARNHPSAETDHEDEQQNSQSQRSDVATPSPGNANKRVRLSDQGETPASNVDDSWVLSPPNTTAQRHGSGPQPADLPRHDRQRTSLSKPSMQHQPGQLLRVTLKNFVTYTDATFFPGPSLNMVIGPNGTGKSTLVCAICIGLGWDTKHLGRAKDLGEFVKHGCHAASIEIELKGHPGMINPIIKRDMKKEGNKSDWTLNGSRSNHKTVYALAKSFNIQIENLCQFLPQDRVVEFSRSTPIEKLVMTLQAAAPPQMTEWHQQLKDYRREQKEAEAETSTVRANLKNLQGRQTLQRADVERMREREEVLENVAMLEQLLPFAEFHQAKYRHDTAKEQHRKVEAELNQLRQEVAPALDALQKKEKYQTRIKDAIATHNRMFKQINTSAEKAVKDLAKAQDDVKDLDKRRDEERSLGQTRKKNMAQNQRALRNFELALEDEPIEFDAAGYNERVRERTREVSALELQSSESEEASTILKRQVDERNLWITKADSDIRNLRTQAGQQTAKLARISSDSAKAWEWCEKNRSEFKGQVYGPPIIECSVKDKRHVIIVESVIQRSEMIAITVTDKADFQMLDRVFKNQLRVADVTLRTSMTALDNPQNRPPVSEEEMHRLGLDGWLLQCLSGPEPVLAMLCGESRLHQTGFMLRDTTEEQYQMLANSNVGSWVTSRSSYKITRRRDLGSAATSTSVKDINNQARYWTDEPVDATAESNAKNRILNWKTEIEQCETELAELNVKIREIQLKRKDVEKEKNDITEEKNQKQTALSEYKAIPVRIAGLQKKIDAIKLLDQEVQARLANIDAEHGAALLRRAELAINLSRNVVLIQNAHKDLVMANVMLIEATSAHDVLVERNAEVTQLLDVKKRDVVTTKEQVLRLRKESKDLMATIQSISQEIKDYYHELGEEQKVRTPDELRLEIDAMRGRLDLLHAGNPHAIEEYERRSRRIEELSKQLNETDEKLSTLAQNMATTRAEFEPELDALIAQISTAFKISFEKIGCSGEVSVNKAGNVSLNDANEPDPATDSNDFESWSIDILVKFREGEQMSVLDSHRQSGGERAVSTIFYLMALQSLSRAPFRVVDEINQGMDPRNERVVHERMVDIACGDAEAGTEGAGSQYFLITPKLLNNLKYSPGMKVHCIASGEYMPALNDPSELDFKTLAKMKRRQLGERAAGRLVDGAAA